MSSPLSDRFAALSHRQARRLVVLTGLVVLALVALVAYVRRVDEVEVIATLLFIPIFLALAFRGVRGGAVAALAATAIYAALRAPAIEALGADELTGLVASRAAAYLTFGVVGGWSMQVLEGALTKLELYDEIDDETGLANARHLLVQTDLEVARAARYQSIFSVVVLDVPTSALAALSSRARKALLRDLGAKLQEAVRTVDRVAHVRAGDQHRFVVVLPETAAAGAATFRERFGGSVHGALAERGVTVSALAPAWSLTVPGDEATLEALQSELARLDSMQHR